MRQKQGECVRKRVGQVQAAVLKVILTFVYGVFLTLTYFAFICYIFLPYING